LAAQHPGNNETRTHPVLIPASKNLKLLICSLLALVLFLPSIEAQADAPPPAVPAACEQSPQGCPLPADLERAQVDPIWWNENKINQINPETYQTAAELLTNPYNTCGPTTLAMVINYMYALRGMDPSAWVTPGQVMAAAKELGFYSPPDNDGLLTTNDLRAIAGKFDLKLAFPKGGGTFLPYETLFAEVKKGFPAIVGMRYSYDEATGEYRPAGDDAPVNHFVVLFGITDDGNYFWLLNPHPGKGKNENAQVSLKLISFDAFRAAWANNDGSSVTDFGSAIFLR